MKLLLLCPVVLLSACNNLVFYQAQRVSVTLEASPQDVTKPIQANIGSKTRTFIVAPQMEGSGDNKGELVSMLGYGGATFADFAKNSDAPPETPTTLVDNNKKITAAMGMEQMTFKTAFVSGQAAKNLANNQSTTKSTGTTGQTAEQLIQGEQASEKAAPKAPDANTAGYLGQQMTKAVKIKP